MLRRRDAHRGAISFVDITAHDYQPEQNGGVSFQKGMAEIHGILPTGEVISGVPVFAKLYEAVGLGWVYRWTAWPPAARLAAKVYSFWAKRRLALTGKGSLEEVLARRAEGDQQGHCDAACRDKAPAAVKQ